MRVPTAILPRHPGETLMARSNRLSAGEMVRLLDPASIDHAPIADRMESEDERYQLLRDSIAETGQTSPILVRPHPCEAGRYQVAFGHRRLRAAAALGRPVRAIVKPLSDRELVIAQGQENSARTDLSFIERGRFAQALEDAGHDRATIMESLAIDKTALSRLISVVNRLPSDIVEAVGGCPLRRAGSLAGLGPRLCATMPGPASRPVAGERGFSCSTVRYALRSAVSAPHPRPQPESKAPLPSLART